MQTHPFTPAYHHARGNSGPEEGKLRISKYNLWKVCYFWGCDKASYVSANRKKSAQFRKKKKKSLGLFLAYVILRSIATAREQVHGLVFLRSSDHEDRSFWCSFISHQGPSRAERGPLSDKSTKIYKHVVLSHKSKGNLLLWGRVGWGLTSMKTFPSQKHNWNVESTASCIEIICSARLNIITGIDFCVAGQSNNCRLFQRLGRMYVEIFFFMGNAAATNHYPSVTWGKKTLTFM